MSERQRDNVTGDSTHCWSGLVPMIAGETLGVNVVVNGGTKTVGLAAMGHGAPIFGVNLVG